jgi:hypothetical protein
MAFPNTSAGTYSAEQDLSIRATAAATSIGVIVGEAPMGPVGVPTLVTDRADVREKFGIKNAKKYGFGLYSAEIFLAQSKRLFYTRVVDPATARTAGAYLSVDDMNAEYPVIKLVNFDDGTNQPLGVLGDPLKTLGFVNGTIGVENAMLYFCAANPGKWNNRLSIQVRPSNTAGTEVGEHSDPFQFVVDVFIDYTGTGNTPVESFLCSRKNEIDGNNQQLFVEDVINLRSAYIRVKNNSLCKPVRVGKAAFEQLDGGADGDRPKQVDLINAWDLYEDKEQILVNLLINSGYTTTAYQKKMDSIAKMRGDCVALLDLPDDMAQVSRAVNYRRNTLNLNSSYSAIYAPFVEVLDTDSNKNIFIPPSAFVGAACAYTDTNRAVWFAPAGLNRGQVNVRSLRQRYNQGARDALDAAQVNIIRNIPGRGFVIMGQSTMQTFDSGFSNLNVRRLVNFIKTSIEAATVPSVFNPNDGFERLKLKNICDDFMRPIKSGRGVYEWVTICDERNNKPASIANNDIKLDLIIDPEIPAKRAHLGANVQPTGAVSFTEA